MTAAAQAWTTARRELRGGLRGFGIFLACLCLGVAVIAGVGSLSAAINAGLNGDARALLGGDIEFNLAQQPASADERGFLAADGALSQVTRLRAMAIADSGATRSLIELKAIDRAYPLYGSVTLDPPQALETALAERDGAWGAVVAPSLLDKLGLKLGDAIRIGSGRFILRASLAHEPDSVSGIYELGPRVMVAQDALASTGLLAPGSLVAYAYRLRVAANADPQTVIENAKQKFPEAGWRIRSFADAAPNLQELLDRVTVFLTLVGLTTLLVGGVGIANAVESYLATKIDTIATLKCLGAARRLVFAIYLLQIVILALGGIALGLALGALVPYAAVPLLPATLPSRHVPRSIRCRCCSRRLTACWRRCASPPGRSAPHARPAPPACSEMPPCPSVPGRLCCRRSSRAWPRSVFSSSRWQPRRIEMLPRGSSPGPQER